jgi:hypothetical protein
MPGRIWPDPTGCRLAAAGFYILNGASINNYALILGFLGCFGFLASFFFLSWPFAMECSLV